MESVSFDEIAPVYDATRVYDEAKFNEALDYIAARFPPVKYPKLFEPGIGTGRIAIPFAERGYQVTGADISGEMLKILAGKLAAMKPPLPVAYIQRDITSLPFPGASFNIAVAVHVFHLVQEWKKAVDEIFRILTMDAPLVLLYTGSAVLKYPGFMTSTGNCAGRWGIPQSMSAWPGRSSGSTLSTSGTVLKRSKTAGSG